MLYTAAVETACTYPDKCLAPTHHDRVIWPGAVSKEFDAWHVAASAGQDEATEETPSRYYFELAPADVLCEEKRLQTGRLAMKRQMQHQHGLVDSRHLYCTCRQIPQRRTGSQSPWSWAIEHSGGEGPSCTWLA
jgi:hypothetical protein